jgi:formate dehydrogenase major subunit
MDARDVRELIGRWPVLRQLRGDRLGLGRAAQSPRSARLAPRTAGSETVARSVCPYCAVGCGQLVHVQGGEVTHIEGDPDSPISLGRLCPKGSASRQFVAGPERQHHVKYRRPFGTSWEELALDQAMDMIADRVLAARAAGWEDTDDQGRTLNRTMGFAQLGGATLDNEENYLIKKLATALGCVQVENQARI